MTWTAKITGVDEVPAEMQEAVSIGTERGLQNLGAKAAEMVQDNIKAPYGDLPPAVAQGFLAASITSTFSREATTCREVIGVGPMLGADVYAAPVETGARPHMPPVSALIPWVQKKFGSADEKTVMSLAFAIATSIAKKGTQGHFMFERANEALGPIAPEILETAIAEALAQYGFKGGQA
jgi:hypothetical protein